MASQFDAGLSGTTVGNMQNTCHLLNIQTYQELSGGGRASKHTVTFSVDAIRTLSESVLPRLH